ncbi:hypothetical protein, partial [uncultured Chryseobacterium sp.]|uniref:hypothetical protein n=1 Tax=uncultured Chryseobacterium sp. TaxID=259322 RepID=UPI0025D6BFC6
TKLNKFYFIECIDSQESSQTNGFALYNDTVIKLKIVDKSIETEYFEFKTKEEFLNILDYIHEKDINKNNILIHIYTHGSSNHDGLLDDDKKLISWEEVLNKSRKINVKSENGLYLILALCHGKYIGEKIDIKQKAPFNSLIASNHEELVSDIYNLFQKFYNNLVFDNDIIKAFIDAQSDGDKFYYKNTNKCVQDAFKSLLEKRELLLPDLYKDFLETTGQKISFQEFDNINKTTLSELIKKMEEQFFIK